MVTLETRYKKNDAILYREFADGPTLIDPYRRILIQLNPTALDVWQRLDGACSVSEIIAALQDGFDVDESSLKKDVIGFLKELIRREMVR